MMRWSLLLAFALGAPLQDAAPRKAVVANVASVEDGPSYTADGQLKMPAKYREWVYLTSGLDTSYTPKAMAADHPVFDNVFVNPSAYQAFLKTGTWPDKTVIVLENRGAESSKSINTRGHTQSAEVMGLEAHVKDESRLKGGWGFYGFDNEVSAKLIDRPASCYTCHEEHAAVDTTFVQFYPTLLGLAKTKGTLSAAYLKETAAPGK
jgi:hypothetical protein